MPQFFKSYPDYTRRALKYHIPCALLDGYVMGTKLLYLIIARKTLDASDLLITILTIAPVGIMIFANIFALKMLGKSKRPYFIATAVIGRAPLLLVFFVNDALSYTIVLLLTVFAHLLFKPAENSIIQANYDKEFRGRIYGYIGALQLLATMTAAYIGGIALDADPNNFHYLFPIAGVAGIASMVLYVLMPVKKIDYGPIADRKPGILEAYLNFFQSLFKDKPFGRFELCFLIYGFGIIMLEPLIIIFFVDELNIEYSQAAVALGFVAQFVILFLTPFMGRFFDGINPYKMLSLVVTGLMFFPLFLHFADSIMLVYAAFLFRGLGMSGIRILWNLGPIHFSGEKDSTNYMGVHMSLTGVRGLLAPLFGMGMYYLFGIRGAFLVSAGLFMTSAILSMYFYKRDYKLKVEKVVPASIER